MFTKLVADKRGFFYTAVVIVVILFAVDITSLVVLLVSNRFFDAFVPYIGDNIQIAGLQTTLRFVGPVAIVAINIGLIVLLVVSAWKRQTVEDEGELLL